MEENQILLICKNKLFIIPVAVMLLIALVSGSAIVYFHQAHVTLIVDRQTLSSSNDNFVFSDLSQGDTVYPTVTIHNPMDFAVNATLSWEETANPNNVNYTVNLPQTIELSSGDTEIHLQMNVDSNSNLGEVDGLIDFARG